MNKSIYPFEILSVHKILIAIEEEKINSNKQIKEIKEVHKNFNKLFNRGNKKRVGDRPKIISISRQMMLGIWLNNFIFFSQR